MQNKYIYIKSYGCQMNVYDSNRIQDLFTDKGYEVTKDISQADLTILNTCHIREKAVEKVYSDIGRIKKIKKNNKKMKLVVAGCVAQAEGGEIQKRSSAVDFVVGPQSYHKLPNMIKNSEETINSDFLQNEKFKNLIYNSSKLSSEFLSIQEGCDKFCSFCVVPYTRGPEFSRPVLDIVNEAKKYASKGIKEIILLGQNVNAYHGSSSDGKSRDLSYLINKISEIDQIKRIRYMTSHPIDMKNTLIETHVKNSKLMPFLHLPIQSGSDNILKKMNRKHTVNDYLKIVDKIRSVRSDIALSSDFIVGFPDETDKDFEKTMKFIEEVKFVIAYSFIYSPRPGTPAQYKDNVSIPEKKARLSALQSLLTEQQKTYNKSFLNKSVEVLFEKNGRHENQFIGRTIYNQSAFTTTKEEILNKIITVKITNSTNFALECQI
ncbi:MAG: tRNA (N6-isopentenyl adenosine(37)-C2)-methylthiotransferase MiaB [Pelagibacteraceae bacterium TMED237]|nr:MAG: tRNA (N6-isopentenyl adenosine(37)-C2)-methylthiotransferase MiaB [Pelagibacteraceae bacterium TMED237]|tara:strand:- start:1797 stop:3098 length:1302 start_codon:yes stop_codon:yes gene_type:complete